MNTFRAAFIKEVLLLVRDRAGMITLFVMPVMLVFIMTLVEDAAINLVSDKQIDLLYCNQDQDSLGTAVKEGLVATRAFTILESAGGSKLTPASTRDLVAKGDYPVGVVIHSGARDTLRSNARISVLKTFSEIGLMNADSSALAGLDSVPVEIYYDPGVKTSLKTAVEFAIGQYSTEIVGKLISQMYSEILSEFLPGDKKLAVDYPQMITLKKQYARRPESTVSPNSTQHNVPAWTLFAMFFILIPLAGSIIQEKDGGTYLRLMTMPRTIMATFAGKILLYFLVCILQVVILFNLGVYLIPQVGLPPLQFGAHPWALVVAVCSSAFAAVGFGVMIGTLTSTSQQAASIGVVLVIVMSALGGLLMPIYLLSRTLQEFTVYSPMNWSLRNFYDIFLRDADVREILPNVIKTLIFGFCTFTIAFAYKALRKVR